MTPNNGAQSPPTQPPSLLDAGSGELRNEEDGPAVSQRLLAGAGTATETKRAPASDMAPFSSSSGAQSPLQSSHPPNPYAKERMDQLMAELPFEVRAILDDDLEVVYPETALFSNGDAAGRRLCGGCCDCGIGLQRTALVLVGIFVGLLVTTIAAASAVAFAVPDSVWKGGVCVEGWTQHAGTCYMPGRNSSAGHGKKFVDAWDQCAELGGRIVSSGEALSLLSFLDKTVSGPDAAPPSGSWWATHSDTCAIVQYSPASVVAAVAATNATSNLKLNTKGKLAVVVTEDGRCDGSAGIMCSGPPEPSTAMRYVKALRVTLSFGLYD